MGPKRVNKNIVTTVLSKLRKKSEIGKAEKVSDPSVRNDEVEDMDLSPFSRYILSVGNKRGPETGKKMSPSAAAAIYPSSEDDEDENKDGELSEIPPNRQKLDKIRKFGFSHPNDLESICTSKSMEHRPVLSTEGVVLKLELPDGNFVTSLSIPGINPNNIIDNWSHRQDKPRTLDEMIWEDNEEKRKERETKMMEIKRAREHDRYNSVIEYVVQKFDTT